MPHMNPLRQLRSLALRDLEAIVTLAETKHFGRASEICRMTQPALSALVRRVEDGLGRRLSIAPHAGLRSRRTAHLPSKRSNNSSVA
jgi:hypothetical protein